MRTPPAFLFDLDGTLADTLGDIAASANHVRERHDLPPVTPEVIRAFVGDGARMLLHRALSEAIGPDDDIDAVLDDAFAAYVRHHHGQCTETVRLYPGVREFVDRLHTDGHPMAVVTNKPARFAMPVVSHLDLGEQLPVVVGGDSLPVRKPDPAPLQHALERLGTVATDATMVGDGVQDLRAGKALGVRTIACLFGFTTELRLREEGADVYWSGFGAEA